MEQTNQEMIYAVRFAEPQGQEGQTDFFFHSLSAIYDRFTEAEIGCKLTNLYNLGISSGKRYENRLCSITREPIYRKRRVTGSNSVEQNLDDETLEETFLTRR